MPLRTSIMHRGTVAVPAMSGAEPTEANGIRIASWPRSLAGKACVLQGAHIRAKANVFKIAAMGLR